MDLVQPDAVFPIMGEGVAAPKTYIPWAVIAPHEPQALRNHTQTLVRLAQRGGLDPAEALAVLEGRDWPVAAGKLMSWQEASLRLARAVAQRVMVRGTAYMPVPRCRLCRHWLRGTVPVLRQPSVGGACENPALQVSLPGEGPFETHGDFGCVQFEARL